MMPIATILVATDFSPDGNNAVSRAALLARQIDARLGLLYVGLAGGTLKIICSHEWADRQLSERDRGDQRFGGEGRYIRDLRQHYHRAGVEHAPEMTDGRLAHSVASNVASMSARSRDRSTVGRRRQRCSNTSAGTGRRGSGR